MENSDRNCVIKFTKNIKKREEEEFQAFPATSFKIFHKNFRKISYYKKIMIIMENLDEKVEIND